MSVPKIEDNESYQQQVRTLAKEILVALAPQAFDHLKDCYEPLDFELNETSKVAFAFNLATVFFDRVYHPTAPRWLGEMPKK